MDRALVLVFSNLKHDARVMRQLGWLRKRFSVTVVCFDADDTAADEIIRLKQTKLVPSRKAALGIALLLRQYNTALNLFHAYSETIQSLKKQKWDLIVANDIDTLPFAFQIKDANTPVVFDAHEYAPRHFEDKLLWRTFFQPYYIHWCKKFIPKTDGMLTVGKGLAKEYEANFGVKPTVITNATRLFQVNPSTLDEDQIRLVHHGIANPSRRLEIMLEMMDLLDDRFTLDLILMTSDFASGKTKAYIETLKNHATKNGRIKILPPVKSSEVVPTINKYDIGVFIIPPVNFNYANTLPNKLFDYIQARLGIAIGPTPEMAEIVERYNLGVVAEEFTASALARKLGSLTHADVLKFKQNAIIASNELNAEANEIQFNNLISSVCSSKKVQQASQ